MKRLSYIVVLILFSSSLLAQSSQGKWDYGTATFTNKEYNVTWKLIPELSWIDRPKLSKDTILKKRSDDVQILVSLSANSEDGTMYDIWDLINYLSENSLYYKNVANEAKRNHMNINDYTADKIIFHGMHAIKTTTDMAKYYPEHKTTVHSIHYSYFFKRDKVSYTLSIISLSVVEDEIELFNSIAKRLLDGFDFIN